MLSSGKQYHFATLQIEPFSLGAFRLAIMLVAIQTTQNTGSFRGNLRGNLRVETIGGG